MDFGLVVACVFAFAGVGIMLAVLLPLPGKIARERSHPSVDAIVSLAWLSLLVWPLWIVAYVWARSRQRR
jgi:hypothetical protein